MNEEEAKRKLIEELNWAFGDLPHYRKELIAKAIAELIHRIIERRCVIKQG